MTTKAKRRRVDTVLLSFPFLITNVIKWQRWCTGRRFICLLTVCVLLPLCRKSSHWNVAPSVFFFCSLVHKFIIHSGDKREGSCQGIKRHHCCIPNHSNTPLPGFIRLRQAEDRLAILCQRRTRKAANTGRKKEGEQTIMSNRVSWKSLLADVPPAVQQRAVTTSLRYSVEENYY